MAQKDPPHVPRTSDKGHPHSQQKAGTGNTPGNPGHSGPGGPMRHGDKTVDSDGKC